MRSTRVPIVNFPTVCVLLLYTQTWSSERGCPSGPVFLTGLMRLPDTPFRPTFANLLHRTIESVLYVSQVSSSFNYNLRLRIYGNLKRYQEIWPYRRVHTMQLKDVSQPSLTRVTQGISSQVLSGY